MKAVIMLMTMLLIGTIAYADWMSKSDELEAEVLKELKESGAPEGLRENFAECFAINITALMDKEGCEELEGKPVSESFDACLKDKPIARQEAALKVMFCLQSAQEAYEKSLDDAQH